MRGRRLLFLFLLAAVFLLGLVHLRVSLKNSSQFTGLTGYSPTHRVQIQRVVKRTNETELECPSIHGKIVVFVMYVQSSIEKGYYGVAMESLKCYFKGRKYETVYVDIDKDERVQKACGKHQQLFFKKHCAAAEYLKDGDWLLVLDADTGVVNPNHCIEEWIDNRVNLIFYERFFNWEVASGNYLARNTPFTHEFLLKWADFEYHQPSNWNGADNGVLQLLILETVIPDAKQEIENCDTIWRNGTEYESYMAYVVCVKLALGATRFWPDKIRIYRRAHGWVRDGFLTSDQWGPSDFMLHGWKRSQVGVGGWESPFPENPNSTLCGEGLDGWQWREKKRKTDTDIRKILAAFEKSSGRSFPKRARVHPHLMLPDIEMAAVRDTLCELPRNSFEIPRPSFTNMQFVATRGKMGFYKSIRASGAHYGLQVKDKGPRRPKLSNDIFKRPETVVEEQEVPKVSQTTPTQSQPVPDLPAPDYPSDYVPRHLETKKL